MYLKRLYIENSGPLRNLYLEFPLADDGLPKPVVLIGGNGSGKTNLLSILADALFESAAAHFTDVVPSASFPNRPWFRIISASTISVGAAGGCALLQFEHDGTSYIYKEKGGTLHAPDVALRAPEQLKAHVSWTDDGAVKEFSISDEQSKRVFESGVYLYLPSSRAESPHWLNRASVPVDDFDINLRFTKRLNKPIYVERGLDQLKQWMLSLLIEVRMDIQVVPSTNGESDLHVLGSIPDALAHKSVWDSMNQILRLILNDPTARFVWMGRNASSRLGVHRDGLGGAIAIDALSAGQATLLNVFGTLLRYGDGTVTDGPALPQKIAGICVIDEIDAHMHIDLQHRALPELIKLFPKIQFVVSSHSPLFAIGMEKSFGAEGLEIIDLPSGVTIHAEAYAEFDRALEVLKDTQAFSREMLNIAVQPGKMVVLVEGETDPIYLSAAAELLTRTQLMDIVEFQWVGSKDAKSGQGFHTGKDALNATANVLRSKPALIKRPVLLLYDNDANKAAADYANLHIRSMPTNPNNSIVTSGIENLLSESAIISDMFDEKITKKGNGSTTITRSLNKMKLCKHLCEIERNPADFAEFGSVLDIVASVIAAEQFEEVSEVA